MIDITHLPRKFKRVDRREVDIVDPARKRLGCLSHEIDRCRSEQEEVPCSISRCAPVIDNSAQGFEERGSTVDLVNDYKLSRLCAQERIRILKTASIDRTLKIQVYGSSLSLCGNLSGQSRLTDLTGPEQNHAGNVPEPILNEWASSPCYHINTGNITANVNIPG